MPRAVYMAILFMLMLFINFGVVGSLFVLYAKDIYGLEAITPIALAFTISSGASIIAVVFVGYLYDRCGITVPASIATASMALWAILIKSMSRSSSWNEVSILWYVGGVFQGLATASIMISVNPTLMMLFPSRKGLAVSVPQSAQALAMSFWSYVAVYLIQMLGFFNALAVMGLTSSISIALAVTVLKKIGEGDIGRGLGGKAKNRAGASTISVSTGRGVGVELAVVYTMILFIALSSIAIMTFLAGIIEEPFVITLNGANSIEYVRTEVVPKVMMITGLVQALSAIPWGYAIDRLGALRVIPAVYALETASAFAAYAMYRASPWAVAGSIALRYSFFTAEPIAHWVLIPTVFGVESLGRVSGVVNSAPMLASLIAPALAGSMRDATGSYGCVLLTSSVLSAMSLVVYLCLKRVLVKK